MTRSDAMPSCPLCQGEQVQRRWRLGDRLFRVTAERFALHECRGCTALFLWPVPDPTTLQGFYPQGYWSAGDGGQNAHGRLTELYRRLVLLDHRRFVRRALADQRRRGLTPRLLDIGGGDGSVLQAIGAPSCLLLDQSRDALRSARTRGIPGVVGEPSRPPLRRHAFTLVSMFHFLEHVSPPGPFLASVRELLAPGGELVVQVPNRQSLQAKLFGRRWAGLDVPRHLIDYGPQTLRATLEQHGFEVVRTTHFSWRDNPTTLANSLLPGLYPPARVARGGRTSGLRAAASDLIYLAATLLATPFTWIESALGRGAAIMVLARPR